MRRSGSGRLAEVSGFPRGQHVPDLAVIMARTPADLQARWRLRRGSPGDCSKVSLDLAREIAMGKEARIGLLLAGTAMLLAVMVDWVREELS